MRKRVFPFTRLTFSVEPTKWKRTDDYRNISKIIRPTLLLLLEAKSLLCCFHHFTLGDNFPRTPEYPGGQGTIFLVFEVQV